MFTVNSNGSGFRDKEHLIKAKKKLHYFGANLELHKWSA